MNTKKVSFHDVVKVTLIPPRTDFADVALDIWWTPTDCDTFKLEASIEVNNISTKNKITTKQAMKLLYQPSTDKENNDKVSEAPFSEPTKFSPSTLPSDQEQVNLSKKPKLNIMYSDKNCSTSLEKSMMLNFQNTNVSTNKNRWINSKSYRTDPTSSYSPSKMKNRSTNITPDSSIIMSPISFDKWLRIVDNSLTDDSDNFVIRNGKQLVSTKCT